MPKISEFFGIRIYLYRDDHHPAHFHAKYAGEDAQINIENLTVMRGRLSPRAMGLVIEWAALHQKELRTAWNQALTQKKISKIEPLR
jgi:hypothetical protein